MISVEEPTLEELEAENELGLDLFGKTSFIRQFECIRDLDKVTELSDNVRAFLIEELKRSGLLSELTPQEFFICEQFLHLRLRVLAARLKELGIYERGMLRLFVDRLKNGNLVLSHEKPSADDFSFAI